MFTPSGPSSSDNTPVARNGVKPLSGVSPITALPKSTPIQSPARWTALKASAYGLGLIFGLWRGLHAYNHLHADFPAVAHASAVSIRPTNLSINIDNLPAAVPTTSPVTQPAIVFTKPKSMTAEQLFAYASPGVVKIIVSDKNDRPISQGSGFFVNTTGLVATNFHVIAGGFKATVLVPNGISRDIIGVRGASEKIDLALLQTDIHPGVVLPLRAGNPEPIGAAAFAIGNPLGMTNTLSAGLISGYRDIDAVPCIQTSAPISPGSSGGPLLNDRGEVLGVTSMTLADGQQLNFAITASQVRSLIAQNDDPRPLTSISLTAKVSDAESVAQASALLAAGKPRDALAILLRLQSQNPKDVRYWEALAAIYVVLNEPENAINACQSGIAIDPSIPALHATLGFELFTLKRWPEAFDAFKKSSELGTKDWDVYAHAGTCCRKMNDPVRAESFYKYAIKLGVPTTVTYGLLANTQATLGHPQDAIATLEDALKLDPTDPHVYSDLGDLHRKLGEIDQATANYTNALRYDPRGQFGRHARAALTDLATKTTPAPAQ
jgi:S1-C subfamily serine protease